MDENYKRKKLLAVTLNHSDVCYFSRIVLFFFIVCSKDTKKVHLAISEEILMASYWQNLSYKHALYKALLKQNIPLNPINDEIYFDDLNRLRVLYQTGDGEKLIDTLNRYSKNTQFIKIKVSVGYVCNC
ncbi:hypothetical protein [Acinetobacter baumannii]|uniref:hypothetical protein n=1 Tax=Acinetobacter baumannii TaxID=470 RepID=UPI002076296F|nr:hypothetical protein [Acinetobacter baumannii]